MLRNTVLTLLIAAEATHGQAAFTLRKTYDSSNFLDSFNFRDRAYFDSIDPGYEGDPTGGSVNYLSRSQAVASGIVNTNNGKVHLGVNSVDKAALLTPGGSRHGRGSVRLESKESYSSGILIADIEHMPGTACGIWPAYWSYNFDEDPVGEIDIIEGINGNQNGNYVSLHTCGACIFNRPGGAEPRNNCNIGGSDTRYCTDGNNYSGCGNTMPSGSYGKTFNANKGGIYATWLTTEAVKIWWFPRNNIPADIKNGKPEPNTWGQPATSQFVNANGNCDVGRYFKKQTIIFNTAFCGSNIDQGIWNQECRASTGYATCDDYVTNQPGAFKEAYWTINSLKLYQ
ncbi:related to mixed-linked glucanase precursor MLG1 [Fusarium torulosum]|uniref:Related to mixed-linked glucanase MLG1 n=1 Tax=Fusarium torulosum TaxID=33205 RepID=A0AAE8SP19_9HYPO|nr:related to mixed-linked glucanase precursor MLG1 [Fusarium torulosum]